MKSVDFDAEASALYMSILADAREEDMHPCSVAMACMDVILLIGRSLPPVDRETLVEVLGQRLDDFVIEEYNEER